MHIGFRCLNPTETIYKIEMTDVENENDMGSKTYNHRRAPKSVPDLKLAESYVAGVLTWFKGMFYVCLCLCIQYGNYDNQTLEKYIGPLLTLRILPFFLLYYDHIYTWKLCQYIPFDVNFIDSTSLSLDVVAGTIVCQIAHIDYSCSSFICCLVCISWTIFSAAHLFYFHIGLENWYHHAIILVLVICILLFSKSNVSQDVSGILKNETFSSVLTKAGTILKVQGSIWPFLFRAAAYLSMCIVDIYFLRSPYQRERDRIGMLRYGSLLFSPSIIVLLSTSIMATTLVLKVYLNFQPIKAAGTPVNNNRKDEENCGESKMCSNIKMNRNKNISNNIPSSLGCSNNINFSELDPNEAFKIAKMHFLDNKAS